MNTALDINNEITLERLSLYSSVYLTCFYISLDNAGVAGQFLAMLVIAYEVMGLSLNLFCFSITLLFYILMISIINCFK